MSKFQVGDVLRIREWDDMAAEFGLDGDEIAIPGAAFVEEMRDLCGQEFTVRAIGDFYGYTDYESEEDLFYGWVITDNMLEYNFSEEEDLTTDKKDEVKLSKFLDAFILKS